MAFLRCTLIFSEAQPRVQLGNLCENKRRDGSIRSLTAKKRAGTSRRTTKVCTLFSLILGKFRLLFFFFFFPPPLSSSPARYILFLFHTGGLHARNIRPRLTCMLLARDLTLVHHPTFVCTSRHLLFSLLFYAACRVK